VAPLLVVAAENVLLALDSYVQAGGTLLVSYFTGILDEDLRFHDSFLGPLADTLGVTIEEFAPFGVDGEITTIKGDITGRATLWQEYLHAGTATVLSSFTEGDLAGWPALTRNVRGTGCAWYFATQPDVDLLADVIAAVLADADVTCHLDSPAHGVETVRRGEVTFILNHNSAPVTVALAGRDIEIAGRDYRILR
jgi:beta-galactosidase